VIINGFAFVKLFSIFFSTFLHLQLKLISNWSHVTDTHTQNTYPSNTSTSDLQQSRLQLFMERLAAWRHQKQQDSESGCWRRWCHGRQIQARTTRNEITSTVKLTLDEASMNTSRY